MRLHDRRGQAIAESLRLYIRQEEVDSDSDDELGEAESPFPSPASPASPTQVGPSAQSSASPPSSPTSLATSLPTAAPPIGTATTSVEPPPALPTASSALPQTSLDSSSTQTTSSAPAPPTSNSQEQQTSSESTSTQTISSAPTLPTTISEAAPISSDSTFTRVTSNVPALIPTSFETQTSSSQSATSGSPDSVLLPSQVPLRGGADNPDNNPGATEPAKRVGTIVGATIGAVGGCVLIGLLIFFLLKRRGRKQRQDQDHEEVLAHDTARSQKSHSRVLDQVMAAVYAWGTDPESIHKSDAVRDADLYPKEETSEHVTAAAGQSVRDSSTKPMDSVRLWLNKVTQHAPSFRFSQGSSLSKSKTGWPSALPHGGGRYQELSDSAPQPRDPTKPPPSFPLLNQEAVSRPTVPPMVARPPSVSAVTEVSSRYTINSNSTWFKWG